jgi:hypothetical protein
VKVCPVAGYVITKKLCFWQIYVTIIIIIVRDCFRSRLGATEIEHAGWKKETASRNRWDEIGTGQYDAVVLIAASVTGSNTAVIRNHMTLCAQKLKMRCAPKLEAAVVCSMLKTMSKLNSDLPVAVQRETYRGKWECLDLSPELWTP